MFDTMAFLKEEFGRPDIVVGRLTTYGLHSPKSDAVRKWFERGAVPGEWFPLLVCIAELDNGSPISLAKYIQPEKRRGLPQGE